jgi:hypothetical protein
MLTLEFIVLSSMSNHYIFPTQKISIWYRDNFNIIWRQEENISDSFNARTFLYFMQSSEVWTWEDKFFLQEIILGQIG